MVMSENDSSSFFVQDYTTEFVLHFNSVSLTYGHSDTHTVLEIFTYGLSYAK